MKKGEIDQLIRGSKNMDRMQQEIDLFVKLIAYFLTHTAPGNFYTHKNPYVFDNDGCRWVIDLTLHDTRGVIEGKIKCLMANQNNGWFLVYQYDCIKKVTNQQITIWKIKEIYETLPKFEEQLRQEFYGWTPTIKPFIEASKIKF